MNQNKTGLINYAVLALPLSFAGLPIYLLAPDYYAVNHGLSLTTVGICLLFLRFADAFIDPFLGRLIDKRKALFKHFMGVSAVALALGILMLFWVPNTNAMITLIWFCSSIFITTFAYSFLSIGYGTQGAMWSNKHSEQISITSLRELFSIIGLILSVTLPFYLFEKMSASAAVKTVSAFMVITLGICYLIYSRFPLRLETEARKTSVQSAVNEVQALGALSGSANLKQLYLIYGLSAFGSAIPAVLVIFFVRDYLGLGNAAGLFLLLYFISGACSIPFWKRLALKKSKLFSWKASMALAIGSFVFVLFVSPGDALLYGLVCLGSGFALGADLSIPPALLSEVISSKTNSSKNAGIQYSGLTCLNKLSLALAAGLSLPVLAFIGFQPALENTPDAMNKLLWLYGGLPCVLKLVAVFFAMKWKSEAKIIES